LKRLSSARISITGLASLILLGSEIFSTAPIASKAASHDNCRFGVTSNVGVDGYDIASLGVGSYLDWEAGSNPSLPNGIEYVSVLWVGDSQYSNTIANLTAWVQANQGSVWLVGNEPDTTYNGQDGLYPEVYADRFFAIATLIRSLDAGARIGFGAIVQPTPIRMRYLDKAWNRLVEDAGSLNDASALIDLWSIHAFILNEQPNSWGTGIPPGFENDASDAVVITNFSDTHSNVIFENRVREFRSWMAQKGERNKPLWITEYGSLFPPTRTDLGVTDQDTLEYMVGTFNFLLSAVDSQTGLATDDNKLVQRWFWYSLNDHRDNFGGSLFDPDNGKAITLVGQTFRNYRPLSLAQPDLFPKSISILPISYAQGNQLVNYQLKVNIGNAASADAGSSAEVKIYNGNPATGGVLIAGPIQIDFIQRCGGTALLAIPWAGSPLATYSIFITVDPIGVADLNPVNNQAEFMVFAELPILSYFPIISR
jgi:hypothetical protein